MRACGAGPYAVKLMDLISADKRYGPIYNQAMAEVLLHGLLRYNYDINSQTPVFIIGYSGAGQMAVGAVAYLRELINGPIYVISLGGIFSSDPGLLAMDHMYHLYGDQDWPHRMGLIAPGRWPFFATSEWNRARRQGLISLVNVGPMCHTSTGGYLDIKSVLPTGVSYLDQTVAVVSEIVRKHVQEPVGSSNEVTTKRIVPTMETANVGYTT